MLRIPCPICGTRDETEFNYGGDATVTRPSLQDGSIECWSDYLFARNNPRGEHKEYWHHVASCRQWLVVERDTVSHVITAAHLARDRVAVSAAEGESNELQRELEGGRVA